MYFFEYYIKKKKCIFVFPKNIILVMNSIQYKCIKKKRITMSYYRTANDVGVKFLLGQKAMLLRVKLLMPSHSL
jgi:membrane-bound inhibitor of C-type lysozyme